MTAEVVLSGVTAANCGCTWEWSRVPTLQFGDRTYCGEHMPPLGSRTIDAFTTQRDTGINDVYPDAAEIRRRIEEAQRVALERRQSVEEARDEVVAAALAWEDGGPGLIRLASLGALDRAVQHYRAVLARAEGVG